MKTDLKTVEQAYGLLNIMVWVVVIAIVKIAASHFFGSDIGWIASLIVILYVIVCAGINAKKEMDRLKKIDEISERLKNHANE